MRAKKVQAARRCRGVTRAGTPCRRPATEEGFCRQHREPLYERRTEPFYARALSAQDRASYAQALTQEGLTEEVAVLRLHLLRLLERGDGDHPAEIPRTVHALVRALKDDRAAADDLLAALDAAIRDEGRRWLESGATVGGQAREEEPA